MKVPEKECSRCGDKKPYSEYRRVISAPGNHISECKSCEKGRREKRKQELSNYIKCF